MKVFVISLAILFIVSGRSNYYTNERHITSNFSVFKSLDSMVQIHASDTIFYCNPDLIKKMEEITGIKANTDVTYFDKISFTMTDYKNWEA